MRLPDYKVDFVSYHFYNAIEDFKKENAILGKAVKKPVVIQEVWRRPITHLEFRGYSEEDQRIKHKKCKPCSKEQACIYVMDFI
jgi:hypothetical protein